MRPDHTNSPHWPRASTTSALPPMRRISRAEIEDALRRDPLHRRAEAGDITARIILNAESTPVNEGGAALFAQAMANIRASFPSFSEAET